MQSEKAKTYRSYLLRCWQEQAAAPGQPPVWRFVVQEVAGEQRRWAFGAFEQVTVLQKLGRQNLYWKLKEYKNA